VLALSKRWKQPEQAYRDWHASGEGFHLGAVQFVREKDLEAGRKMTDQPEPHRVMTG
jgi:hypothetical protein